MCCRPTEDRDDGIREAECEGGKGCRLAAGRLQGGVEREVRGMRTTQGRSQVVELQAGQSTPARSKSHRIHHVHHRTTLVRSICTR